MNTMIRHLFVSGALLCACHSLVQAQHDRHGNWMDFGLGVGSAASSCDTCTGNQRLGGWAASFGLGGTLSSHLRLGGDVRVWLNGLKPSAPLPGMFTVTLLLSYYRRAHGGPFVAG